MSSLIPGVHVAEILHTAAWMDFSNYVRSAAGSWAESPRHAACGNPLWKSSITGPTPTASFRDSGVTGGPASTLHGVTICTVWRTRGGFRFPFVGDLGQDVCFGPNAWRTSNSVGSLPWLWGDFWTARSAELLVTRAQLVPPHVCCVVERLVLGRDGITIDAGVLWAMEGLALARTLDGLPGCHQSQQRQIAGPSGRLRSTGFRDLADGVGRHPFTMNVPNLWWRRLRGMPMRSGVLPCPFCDESGSFWGVHGDVQGYEAREVPGQVHLPLHPQLWLNEALWLLLVPWRVAKGTMPGRSGRSSDLGLGEGRSRPWNVLLKCDGYAFENYADAEVGRWTCAGSAVGCSRSKAEEGLLGQSRRQWPRSAVDECELRDSKTAIWRRYRLKFSYGSASGRHNRLKGGVGELSKRMLCVFTCGRSRHCSFNWQPTRRSVSWGRTFALKR